MPKEPTFGFRKQQRLGRENNVKVEKPKKSAPSFSRQRFGMDPTISTSVSQRNAAALGAGKEYQGKALANDENKRQANMAGKMRQQMLNTRKANQFRAEQRRNAMRSRMRGAGRAGGAIAAGLGAVGAMSDALSLNEAQINKAKSQTRMQGAPSPNIGAREQLIGQRQGRMFNERGQATSAKSVMPPKKGVMSKGTAGKTSTAKAGPSRAPITKALGIKK